MKSSSESDILQYFPATLLLGARQVGKSTLTEQLVTEKQINQYITLDILTHLEAARHDPDGFLQYYENSSLALDEIQRAPDLMRALKKTIDENRQPGRFLLTGSANILSYPEVSESLAGRIDIVHLEGLSIAELENQLEPPAFVRHLFEPDPIKKIIKYSTFILKKFPQLKKSQLSNWIFFGGFPELAIKQNARFSNRWYSSYFTTYIERDIRDLAKYIDVISFSKVFRLIALRTANLLNIKNLSMDSNLDQRTTNRYLQLLEMTFQINSLSPWHSNARKRLVKTPKIFLNDSGLNCHLAGIDYPEALGDHPMFSALLETWFWGELRKQLALLSGIYPSYYRTHQGKEIDFVLEKGMTRVGLEIKAASNVTRKDFSGLLDMQNALDSPLIGIIFYLGDSIVHFSENLLAVPLQCFCF